MKPTTCSSCSIVGVTGYIGAGKSTVVKKLNQLGLASIDCDQVAKGLLWDEAVQERLTPLQGSDAFVNKVPQFSIIASRIFNHKILREAVNGILHPLVWKKVEEVTSVLSGIVLIESALLLSISIPVPMQFIVEVTCDESVRLSRLMSFRHMNEEDARARMELQAQELQIRHPHIQLDTNLNRESCDTKVALLYEDIVRKAHTYLKK